jgi:hypothetical protein
MDLATQRRGLMLAVRTRMHRTSTSLTFALVVLGCSSSSDAPSSSGPTGDSTQANEAGALPGVDASGGGTPDGGSADDAASTPDAPEKAGCVGPVPLTYAAPTDRLPHPATPPTLGPAGSVVKDPVYGTSIVRLTDPTTIAANLSFRVANEFWGNDWNTDATLFYMQASNGAFLPFTWDPVKLVAARVPDKTTPGSPLKMPLAPGGFSRTSPSLFYGMKALTIEQYDFTTQSATPIVDLATVVAGATGYSLGVEQGANGLLASVFGGPQQDAMPYVVTYDPATKVSHVVDVTKSTLDGQPIGATIGGGVHTFKLDHSGQYLVFTVSGGGSGSWIWDTAAQTVKTGSAGNTLGWAAWVDKGRSSDAYDWEASTFALPSTSAPLVAPLLTPLDKLASSSMSWQNAVGGGKSAPVIVETMRQPSDSGPLRAWDDELLALSTDGTQSTVWRFAHTFNTYSGTTFSDNFYYLFIPRVSQNGWFVLFDSNWNGTLGTDANGNPRTDAFIAVLPNTCGP